MKKRNQRAYQFILIALLCGSVGFAPAAAWAQSAKEKTDSVVSGKKTPTSPDPAPPKKEEAIPPLSEVDPLPEPALVGPDSEGEALSTETPYLEEREPKNIEEIIVTASKRAESIQDVSISMTALGGQTLRDAGITTFNELQQYVPNLEIIPVTDTRSTSIRIRGIGSVGSNAGIDPSVGVFIDGVYQGRAGMSVGDLLDIERVEVLRGPQGTLYGKNTAAGALNIITRRPTYEKEAFLEGVFGNYRDLQGRAYVNLPLVEDTLAFRVAGYYSSRDGWDINRYNNQDVNNVNKWGLRGKLLWDVTDDLAILLTGDYSSENSRSFVPEIIDYLPAGSSPPTTSLTDVPFDFLALSQGRTLPVADPFDFRVGANVEPINRVDVGGLSLDALYQMGDFEIRWLNAWRTYSTDSQFDADFSEFDGIVANQNVNLNQFSSELTLTSPGNVIFEYQAGLYFFYMNMDTVDGNGWRYGPNGELPGIVTAGQYACNTNEDLPVNPSVPQSCNIGVPGASLFNAYPSLIFIAPLYNINTNTHETKSFAAYAQGKLKLLDSLHFVMGGRLSWEKKTRDGISECEGFACALLDAPPLIGPTFWRNDELSTTNFQYRFALEYEPSESSMLYASVANGFKSGGFNQLRTVQGEPSEFGDEKSLTYELGLRSTWFERQVVFNMTGYFTDYDEFQSQIFTGATINVRNAGRLFSYGFESDFVYMPEQIENLRLGAAVGLNIARYKDFDKAAATVAQQVTATQAQGQSWPGTDNDGFFLPAAVACGYPVFVNCSQDLAGKTLDNAPEWNISLFGAYERLLPSTSIYVFGRADYSYSSSLFLDQDLDPFLFQPSYHLLNLRAGVRAEDELWELTFWMTNVTNSEYLVTGFDVPILSGFAGVRGPPRQFGATVRLLF